jgi:hypothetical protein
MQVCVGGGGGGSRSGGGGGLLCWAVVGRRSPMDVVKAQACLYEMRPSATSV